MKHDEISIFLVFALTGFAVLFGTVMLFQTNGIPLYTFWVSTAAGLSAIAVSGLWLLRYSQGSVIYVLVLSSYLVRILFGIYVYNELDPGYFEGDGSYKWGHNELELSFNAVRIVYYAMASNDGFTLAFAPTVLNEGDSKNPIIHWWMGSYLAISGSANAMDLSAFNAFHMLIAALGIIALSLNLGYSRRAAFLAGIVTAWYPFSFISSLLWRDGVGFAFVVVALVLARKFKFRRPSTWPLFAGAIFLSFFHRTVYPVVIVLAHFLSVQSSTQGNSQGNRSATKTVYWFLGIIISLVGSRLFSDYLFLYYSNFSVAAVLERIIFLPILFVRAILGPFPWFNDITPMMYWSRIFDYALHVLQFAVLLCIAQHYRRFFRAPDISIIAFLLFFGTSMLAPGIHTAYLSVGLPFALARIFSLTRNFSMYFFLSFFLFMAFNALFYVLGFSGEGFSQSLTGY